MSSTNIALNPNFSQVCVWPATVVANEYTTAEFEKFMLDNFNTRVQYLEEIKTNPDLDDLGRKVFGTGDRNDLFFAVHNEDIGKFALPRLQYGIRWIEDVLSPINHGAHLYPARVKEYCTWDANVSQQEIDDFNNSN